MKKYCKPDIFVVKSLNNDVICSSYGGLLEFDKFDNGSNDFDWSNVEEGK